MATETDDTATFGRVSRARGAAFEALSFGASVLGIVALAVLLVSVAVDAFDLEAASPGWLLTYFLTLVLPFVSFCLYSAGDRALVRKTAVALGGGMIGTYVLFRAVEALIRPIPRLSWHLAYLFVVVVPVTAAATVVGSRHPIGRVGLGVVGRLVGGVGLGLGLLVLFVVVDAQLWFLTYTLGVLPGAGVLAYGRCRPSSPASLFVVPVTVGGVATGIAFDGVLVVPLSAFAMYVWTLAVPVSLAVAAPAARDASSRAAAATGAVTLVLAVGGSVAADPLAGVAPEHALPLLLTTAVPTVEYVRRVLDRKEGTVGLALPVLLVGGALAGAVAVGVAGFPAPDPWLDYAYVTSPPSITPADAGLYPAIVGSVLIIAIVAVVSFALGVGTAVFLEDYTPGGGIFGTIARIVQINIANLAAVPSVVYGMLGLGLFANLLGMGYGTVITAAVTLSLLILPITIISAQEAVRSVPDDLRRGSYAMGATRWQTVRNVVLPEALPGILTGTILALGRAIGETAPLLMIGAFNTVYSPPDGLFDTVSAMPLQIYVWADQPQPAFRYGVLAAGVVALLIVLIGMNGAAIVLRNRYQ